MKVFVYGTLQIEAVLLSLLKRVPAKRRGRLMDYKLYGIRGRSYPAIVPCHGEEVNGMLLEDLSLKEVEVMDAYEEEEYRRDKVMVGAFVEGEDRYDEVEAEVYVARPGSEMESQLEGGWSLDHFLQTHYDNFFHQSVLPFSR